MYLAFIRFTRLKVFVVEAIKYAIEHPEYQTSIEGNEENEFSNLHGDEFEEEDMAEEFTEENPNQDDLYDEDAEPLVLNIEDDNNPAETLDIHSTAQIYTSSTGKIAVPQHVHYAHRGVMFKDYSLYEFASIVDVVQKKKEKSGKVTGR